LLLVFIAVVALVLV